MYQVDSDASMPFAVNNDGFSVPLDLSRLSPGGHTLTVSAKDSAGNTSVLTTPFSMAKRSAFGIANVSPSNGADKVGSTFRPQVFFSRPVDTSSLNSNNIFVTDTSLENRDVKLMDGDATMEVEGSPEIIVEVISPTSVRKDQKTLRDKYWQAGVKEYWLADRSTGLRSDATIVLAGPATSLFYPEPFRRVGFYDVEHRRKLVFLTNNFDLPALTIAQLYRARWRVELFFKWIKQNLHIKRFYGNSENAVKTQVWIAISVYALIAIVRKQLRCTRPMSELLQILSLTLFEKTPLNQAFLRRPKTQHIIDQRNYLPLFD